MQSATNFVQIHTIYKGEYKSVWEFQGQLLQKLIQAKRSNSSLKPVHHLIFCEHFPVYTLGKSGSMDNLLLDTEGLEKKAASFYKINRGGDITFHGPGQWTIYPIFDLEFFYRDLHRYIRELEECIRLVTRHVGVETYRIKGLSGVWHGEDKAQKKVCAVGVHMSRWVSMHGLGFNVNTDLAWFDNIIPCGIDDKGVISLSKLANTPLEMEFVKKLLVDAFCEVFKLTII